MNRNAKTEKEIVVQPPPKSTRLVKADAASGKYRREKVRCDECGAVVAERRADGTIVIRGRHHGEDHVTIIEPWSLSAAKEPVDVVGVKPATGPDVSKLS